MNGWTAETIIVRPHPAGREMSTVDCARLTPITGSRRHKVVDDVRAKLRANKTRKTSTEERRVQPKQDQEEKQPPTAAAPEQPEVIVVCQSDDDDDKASVSSNRSSASERSTTSRGSNGSRPRRRVRCPVHPNTTKTTAPDGEEVGGGGIGETAAPTSGCTCNKTRRRRRSEQRGSPAVDQTTSADRPEPEGLPATPFKTTMDDFERLIYGPSEPLFSDCEDVDGEVPQPTEELTSAAPSLLRLQRRRLAAMGGTAEDAVAAIDSTEGLFSSAQMVNSNNMMKFAIIQTELKNVKDMSLRRAETDVTSMWRRVEAVSESCSQTEGHLNTATDQLNELLADLRAASKQQEQRLLECRQPPVDHRPARNGACDVMQCHVTNTGMRRQLMATGIDVYKAEESLYVAEKRVAELEEELKTGISSMSSSSSASDQQKEKMIRDITLRLKEAEHKAANAEKHVYQLRHVATKHADEMNADKKKYHAIGSYLSSCTFTELTGC